MTRWQQVEAVLQAALDRPAADRAEFLNEACAGDSELKQEAASLIEAHDEAGDFIEQPAITHDAHILVGHHPQFQIGRNVGPYEIIERLGGGGMGDVYLAQDVRLKRLVALKILPAYFVSDRGRLRRFQTEARAASALNHPNILTIYEVGEADDVHFIATEFIEGQTLRELISSNGLTRAEVLDVVGQLMSGLSAAHAAGIVHRDIKPENLMRRSDGLVKILDFGIAKVVEPPAYVFNDPAPITRSQTDIGVVMGTVGYMSPEQARGLPVDERTDIWSSGVVLYEMLARRAPFSGDTRLDTMVAILEREPPPLFQISNGSLPVIPEIEQIVSRSLCKEATDRYQTAVEMLEDLAAVRQQLRAGETLREQAPRADLSAVESYTDPESRNGSIANNFAPEASTGRRLRVRLLVPSVAVLLIGVIAATLFYQRSRLLTHNPSTQEPATIVAPATTKLYIQMNTAEQLEFVDQQEQRISAMMGDRPVKLNAEALNAIKAHVDRYVSSKVTASGQTRSDNLRTAYGRAIPYVPLIARSFASRKIPLIVGIYIPMIESAYEPCLESRFGGKGLFQFLPVTARNYGVAPEDMCNAEKMTPAAAHYIADRMAELGDDSQSMTLVVLSYNHGPEWVRDSLRQLREAGNYERNFWTLFANRDMLDGFRDNAGYVPTFFAAAIIGENPRNFDLQLPPLSTLAGETSNAGK